MRRCVPLITAAGAAAVLLTATLAPAALAGGDTHKQSLRKASSGDPYADCTAGATPNGVVYPGSEVEPFVSVDPRDGRRAVAVWQQDRWSDGGARGLAGAWTEDGRTFHQVTLPFTVCAPGGSDYERSSDPWVSTGPDGTVYASGLSHDVTTPRSAILATTSTDGGRTWSTPVATREDNDPAIFNDKPSITADPVRRGTAYQVWDRTEFFPTGPDAHVAGPAYLSVTRDGGRTWGPARPIVNNAALGPNAQTFGNVIVVDPRSGTLYNFFTWITYADPTAEVVTDSRFAVVTSNDGGRTWSAPVTVAPETSAPEVHPNAPGTRLRAGAFVSSPAVDPKNGTLYLAYQGSDFSSGAYNQAQLVRSTDGGRTWSAPELISRPGVPAFSPAITVDKQGTVAVLYYDLRYLRPDDTTTLPTVYWLASLPDGSTHRRGERRISPVFDWLQAPFAGGYFLGDYQGLALKGKHAVRPALTLTNTGTSNNPTDVHSGVFRIPRDGSARPRQEESRMRTPDARPAGHPPDHARPERYLVPQRTSRGG
ncbi:sialidase family protein [Streptomyces coeruleoprunus]|uniref:exo-alpha-sialidase n=1 Tax=Streptomyces coeruleoprunus TaxID=285563 RepID=A0ABV9XIK4_9ACTN